MDRGAWWATIHGSQRLGHDLTTKQQHHIIRFSFNSRCLDYAQFTALGLTRQEFYYFPYLHQTGKLKKQRKWINENSHILLMTHREQFGIILKKKKKYICIQQFVNSSVCVFLRKEHVYLWRIHFDIWQN